MTPDELLDLVSNPRAYRLSLDTSASHIRRAILVFAAMANGVVTTSRSK